MQLFIFNFLLYKKKALFSNYFMKKYLCHEEKDLFTWKKSQQFVEKTTYDT